MRMGEADPTSRLSLVVVEVKVSFCQTIQADFCAWALEMRMIWKTMRN